MNKTRCEPLHNQQSNAETLDQLKMTLKWNNYAHHETSQQFNVWTLIQNERENSTLDIILQLQQVQCTNTQYVTKTGQANIILWKMITLNISMKSNSMHVIWTSSNASPEVKGTRNWIKLNIGLLKTWKKMYCCTRIGAIQMFSWDAISAALGLGKSQAVLKPYTYFCRSIQAGSAAVLYSLCITYNKLMRTMHHSWKCLKYPQVAGSTYWNQ